MSKVTVVIPNWNGRDLLATVALPSLARQTEADMTVLVVDNGSSDGSVPYLREEWPNVEVLALPENIGFAGAVNRGIEHSDAPFVALVNSDVELTPTWVSELLAVLEANASAGSAVGKI